MSLSLLLVLLVVFAFAAGRWLTGRVSKYVALSGVEYILVGVLIGPHTPWAMLGDEAIAKLTPLMYLLLGLAGLNIGLRGRRAAESAELAIGAVLASVLVFVCTAVAYLFALSHVLHTGEADFYVQQRLLEWGGSVLEIWASNEHLWLATGLAACATVASSAVVRDLMSKGKAKGPTSTFISSCANVSELTAVVALGLLLAASRATSSSGSASLTIVEWSLSAVAVGVVCGVLFGLFIGRETHSSRIFLATVGLVTFASGVGSALGVSPLFTNLLAGLTVSLISPHAATLAREMERLNHALFVLLMIFAGTLWSPPSAAALWLAPVAYFVVRAGALRLFVGFSRRTTQVRAPAVPVLGNALLGQGAMAVAIALNLALREPQHAGLILTTVLLGALLSDLFSLPALRSVLADAGELQLDASPGSSVEGDRAELDLMQREPRESGAEAESAASDPAQAREASAAHGASSEGPCES